MKKVLIGLGVLLLLIIMVASSFIGLRNKFIQAEETVNASWAQVENVYQRRADLIPNLVATVKGYAAHERETLQGVVEARSKVGQISEKAVSNIINSPEQFAKFQQAQEGLSGALSRLMVVVERYPDLKANQNFIELQSQLEGTENRIAVERRRYNETAMQYNVMIRQFPGSLVANFSGFQKKEFFKAQSGAETAPKVEF